MTTPPPPSTPPTVHLPTPADTTADDWWEALYGDGTADAAEVPTPRAVTAPAGRLPFWWTGEGVALGEDAEEVDTDPVPPCEHPELLEVHDTYGELVAYLCPACDAQLEVDTDEDEPKPRPYERLAASARSVGQKASGWLPAGATGITLNPRARRLLYNGSAAGLGWFLHIGPPIKHLVETCGREAGIGASLFVGVGICGAVAVLVDRRTRHWWPPLAWVCRAPLAAAVLALLLYAPATI
ncbi:hypothetical protein SLV14_003911 [Streptomyces sp. Je 1-4]|uniref:hypothetical protein n=1 Tax=Streptomyces TaxID=1883 RepID=UPI0021D850C3|nr:MULTISPECIES: hypothetical protein [unclassified Streptomyces]UYB41197.1 hypothetical protein SLV14_003911 [Streptomyces sp. Je 1-4]UZQ37375.1 hypothetical protein SLV14N_003911 [Streptomyces sp. Je 1-4] [Streptomyces sp. Je 1-4 4N24]UZQ44792.1 hypothetical protein SLV14NA_003911 [Streptomyces sp. Je 1-4] [Streptomyces sp. Je 1-4 4N24_ara]